MRVRKTFLRQNQKRLDQQAAEPAIEKPLVKIKIYNKTYYALLDSGSNVSVLGSKVFAELKAKNAPTWYANKSLEMLDGSIKITGRAQVPVHTIEGKIEHQFYSVNDSSNQIILGMDYMAKAKIGISPLGWFKTKTPYKLNKFVKDYNETLYCNRLRLQEKEEILPILLDKIENDENQHVEQVIRDFHAKGTFSKYPGKAIGVEQKIEVDPTQAPYQSPLRPMNRKQRRIMNTKIKELIKLGIVEKSNSDFLSTPVLVIKSPIKKDPGKIVDPKDEENPDNWRLVIDSRALNSRLVNVPAHQIPTTEYNTYFQC